MKTFNEYINEKQNFIFGGKSHLTGKEYGSARKMFSELKEGDKFYVWISMEEKEVLEMTFSSTYDGPGDQNYIVLETIEDEPFQINKNDFESSFSYGKSKENDWCIATTFDELQETVDRLYGVKIEKDNITNWP